MHRAYSRSRRALANRGMMVRCGLSAMLVLCLLQTTLGTMQCRKAHTTGPYRALVCAPDLRQASSQIVSQDASGESRNRQKDPLRWTPKLRKTFVVFDFITLQQVGSAPPLPRAVRRSAEYTPFTREAILSKVGPAGLFQNT